MTDWLGRFRAAGSQSVNGVNSVTYSGSADADAADERAAIQAEPELPPLGTPERAMLDQQQAAIVAGLLKAARHAADIEKL